MTPHSLGVASKRRKMAMGFRTDDPTPWKSHPRTSAMIDSPREALVSPSRNIYWRHQYFAYGKSDDQYRIVAFWFHCANFHRWKSGMAHSRMLYVEQVTSLMIFCIFFQLKSPLYVKSVSSRSVVDDDHTLIDFSVGLNRLECDSDRAGTLLSVNEPDTSQPLARDRNNIIGFHSLVSHFWFFYYFRVVL